MKTLFLMALLAFSACTSTKNHNGKNDFLKMSEAWENKKSKEEIIKLFGENFKEIKNGISYNYENTSFTKMAFFFDSNQKLIEQYAITDMDSLQIFKKDLPCEWTTSKTNLRTPHAVKTVEYGECLDQSVKYSYKENLNLYEIRWSRR